MNREAYLQKSRERFSHFVLKTETCHLWQGNTNKDGYGLFSFEGRPQAAHRVAWILGGGKLKPKQVVRHFKCRTPGCVRFDHLKAGTHRDNMRDRKRDGNYATGLDHPLAALTAEQEAEIVADLHAGRFTRGEIARVRGVDKGVISRLCRRHKIRYHLTLKEREKICKMYYEESETQRGLAKLFNCDPATIRAVLGLR